MTPFEHTVAMLSLYTTKLRVGTFLGTPALNALPSRVYVDGKLTNA